MKLAKIRILVAILFFLVTFYSSLYAIPGDLDKTFDADGKTTTSIGVYDEARDVAIQPDGKIVVVGFYDDGIVGLPDLDLSLTRFNADGSLDTTFGTGGKVVLLESGTQPALSVLLQTDGKILAFGSHENHLAVYRFNINGSLDTTFGTNGRIVHIIGISSEAADSVFQPDGKIVLAGHVSFAVNSETFTVFRLNADGSLDTTFNSIGYRSVPINGEEEVRAKSVVLQGDGKIIAGGYDADNYSYYGYWGRFNTNGTLEGGVSNLIRTNVQINGAAIQADGKLVFVGYIESLGPFGNRISQFGIARYNSDKSLDIYFGNSGVSTVYFLPNSGGRANSILIQSSGRIIVGGGARGDFGLARLNPHGFLDLGFGSGGKVTIDFDPSSNEIYGKEGINSIAQQPDGKIIAVGNASIGTASDFGVARYDGSDSATLANRAQFDYDGDGRADVSVFRPSTNTWYIFNSGNSTVHIEMFGSNGDIPAPADFDADAKTDIAIMRNGGWWYRSSLDGLSYSLPWTGGGNFARPGDFGGDGRADLVAYQTSNGLWSRHSLGGSQTSNVTFGTTGDKPLLGDFDGDVKTDPAIYRPSTGEWWYAASSAGGQHRAGRWGISTDIPVPGDYDADGKTDFAVFRPSNGVWYIANSGNGSFTFMNWGLSEDRPVAADYDGDGKTDIAVFRPSTGVWYLLQTTAGFGAFQWGVATDVPTPNAFVP
ncbi:MAG: FG-GAP-like repeat-containing protein [Pyrinomonadaceae bacterium]